MSHAPFVPKAPLVKLAVTVPELIVHSGASLNSVAYLLSVDSYIAVSDVGSLRVSSSRAPSIAVILIAGVLNCWKPSP